MISAGVHQMFSMVSSNSVLFIVDQPDFGKPAIVTEAERNQVRGQNDGKVFEKNYLSTYVRVDLQGYYADGIGLQDHIDRLLNQATFQRDNVPRSLPKEILEEIGNSEEALNIRREQQRRYQQLGQFYLETREDMPKSLKSTFRGSSKQRRAFLAQLEAEFENPIKKNQVVQLFNEAYKAYAAERIYLNRTRRQRFSTYREAWFKQANDALCAPAIDLLFDEPAPSRTTETNSPLSSLSERFYPKKLASKISVVLVNRLIDLCNPKPQNRHRHQRRIKKELANKQCPLSTEVSQKQEQLRELKPKENTERRKARTDLPPDSRPVHESSNLCYQHESDCPTEVVVLCKPKLQNLHQRELAIKQYVPNSQVSRKWKREQATEGEHQGTKREV
jgi:hypothetical protein